MRMSGGDGQAGWGMEAHEDSATGSACDGRSKDVSPRVKVAWAGERERAPSRMVASPLLVSYDAIVP
jgi:hypothetical protein